MDKDTQKMFEGIINRDINFYKQHFNIDTGNISDGRNTFRELYNEIKRLHGEVNHVLNHR